MSLPSVPYAHSSDHEIWLIKGPTLAYLSYALLHVAIPLFIQCQKARDRRRLWKYHFSMIMLVFASAVLVLFYLFATALTQPLARHLLIMLNCICVCGELAVARRWTPTKFMCTGGRWAYRTLFWTSAAGISAAIVLNLVGAFHPTNTWDFMSVVVAIAALGFATLCELCSYVVLYRMIRDRRAELEDVTDITAYSKTERLQRIMVPCAIATFTRILWFYYDYKPLHAISLIIGASNAPHYGAIVRMTPRKRNLPTAHHGEKQTLSKMQNFLYMHGNERFSKSAGMILDRARLSPSETASAGGIAAHAGEISPQRDSSNKI